MQLMWFPLLQRHQCHEPSAPQHQRVDYTEYAKGLEGKLYLESQIEVIKEKEDLIEIPGTPKYNEI